MGVFKEIFAWWTGNTIGTRFYTWRNGTSIGTDDFGNTYYEQRSGVGPLGRPRRWVTYAGDSDPTSVPPEWHGWLHYTTDIAPPDQHYQKRPWEKEHRPNKTGTPEAYRPQGSVLNLPVNSDAPRDYTPWKPGD